MFKYVVFWIMTFIEITPTGPAYVKNGITCIPGNIHFRSDTCQQYFYNEDSALLFFMQTYKKVIHDERGPHEVSMCIPNSPNTQLYSYDSVWIEHIWLFNPLQELEGIVH